MQDTSLVVIIDLSYDLWLQWKKMSRYRSVDEQVKSHLGVFER